MADQMLSGGLSVAPLSTDADAQVCAAMMAASEPWITLGRSYDASLRIIQDPSREVHVARIDDEIVGFLILCMTGVFVGYVQTICIRPERRGQGLGTQLLQFAEERIFRDAANVFLSVSSFNTDAKRLYMRLGYQEVGELKDYLAAGLAEILLRKTIGPLGTRDNPPLTR